MIPVLVFSHLATTYLDMERKRLYDPVMPFHAPPISFIWTRMFIHDIQHTLFLGTIRAVPLVLLAYLAFSKKSGTAIIAASISY